MEDVSDPAFVHGFFDGPEVAVPPAGVEDGEHRVVGCCCANHQIGLGDAETHRLVYHHVPSGVQALHRKRGVGVVRGDDADHLDVCLCEEARDTVVRLQVRVFLPGGLQAFGGSVADGYPFEAGGGVDPSAVRPAEDVRGTVADHGTADGCFKRSCHCGSPL